MAHTKGKLESYVECKLDGASHKCIGKFSSFLKASQKFSENSGGVLGRIHFSSVTVLCLRLQKDAATNIFLEMFESFSEDVFQNPSGLLLLRIETLCSTKRIAELELIRC